jgi:ubiquitin thioesterase protein OTUB1
MPSILLTRACSGHYDILYKTEEVPSSIPQPSDVRIFYANYDEFVPQEASVPDDVMTMIPGLCGGGLGQRWPPLSYDFSSSPAPQAQVTPVQPFPSASMSAPSVTSSFVTPIHTGQTSQYNPPRIHSIQLEQPPITLPIHPPPPPPPPVSIERATPLAVERGGPFRPSMYELEPGFGFSNQAQPFQTSIFRK